MNRTMIFLGAALCAAPLVGQSGGSTTEELGARLKLEPSAPLTELRFPKPKPGASKPPASDAAARREPAVRPAILNLKPVGDPIYLVEEPGPDADRDQWRTYRRPKVDRFSKDGEGIGIQGYDVVSYIEKRAEKGRKEFSFEHDGVTWHFANAEHRDLFRKDPERYLPEYGGFCAYSVGRGYPATADPRAYAIEGGKLYLFFDKAVQTVWGQDQRRLVAGADRYWPQLHR